MHELAVCQALIGQVTDVSDGEAVDALAARAFDEFGTVAVVCNNAGVAGIQGGPDFIDVPNWEWVIGVNLWGVIHGIHAFVPRLIDQGGDAHIVNTASFAGLVGVPSMAPYCTACPTTTRETAMASPPYSNVWK